MGDQGSRATSSKGMDNVVKKRKRTPNDGSGGDTHFVSRTAGECEKKTVTWEIENISNLMSDKALNKAAITFDAGHSIGVPATWNFYLAPGKDVGGYLGLSTKSEAKAAKAGYSITLSCLGKTIVFHEFNPQEFKGGSLGWPLFSKQSILETTDNGKKALNITLRVKVFPSKGPKPVKVRKLRNATLLKKERDFEKLLGSEDGADVEIRVPNEVGGQVDDSSYTKKVHKRVLTARSSVFATMFAEDGEMVEAKTGKVVIEDLSPMGLDIFLHYLYTGKVQKAWLQVPQEILNASEKYDCQSLKYYCGQNLISAVSTCNAWELFQVAKLHKLSSAKNDIVEFIHNNTRGVLEDEDDISDEYVGEESEEEVDESDESEEEVDESDE